MSLTVDGEKRVGRWFLDFQKGYPRGLVRHARAEMLSVFALAKKYAPVRTGRLVNSAFVDVDHGTGGDFEITVGFATSYAAAVHALHRTKARFLARAMEERRPGMEERIARRAFKEMRGGR